jgi:death-on-curing protein
MIYLNREEIIQLQTLLIAQSGGMAGIRDPGLLDSAAAQPQMTYGGSDCYATIAEKASALGFSLIKNHAFMDGNKRIGHAAMEAFLILNGFEIVAPVDEQESLILDVAAGAKRRDELTDWLRAHITPI